MGLGDAWDDFTGAVKDNVVDKATDVVKENIGYVGDAYEKLGDLADKGLDNLGVPYVGDVLDAYGDGAQTSLNLAGDVFGLGLKGIGGDIGLGLAIKSGKDLWDEGGDFLSDPSWDSFKENGRDFAGDYLENSWEVTKDFASGISDSYNDTIDNFNDFSNQVADIFGDANGPNIPDGARAPDFGDKLGGWLDEYVGDGVDIIRDDLDKWEWGKLDDEDLRGNWFDRWIDRLTGGDDSGDSPFGTGPFGPGGWGGLFGGGAGGPVEQGMNRSAVLDIAEQLAEDRERLAQLVEEASQAVSTLAENWDGPDSNRFESDWSSKRPRLDQSVTALEKLAATLREQAGQQESTSSR